MPNQNIYNDPSFFEGYSRLRWSETGLNKVMEEPAIRSLMPDLAGKRVLDLGAASVMSPVMPGRWERRKFLEWIFPTV